MNAKRMMLTIVAYAAAATVGLFFCALYAIESAYDFITDRI